MISAALLNARILLELSTAVDRERELLLGEENSAAAAATVHKLTRVSSVSMAMAADVPGLSRKLRMAALELHAAEEALRREQTAFATRALGNALVWIDAARSETGGTEREASAAEH